ncbi:MAB_1171c family putative transporter [Streptomyces broussonetiae]|uniref:MAB_1171c family putative transporter n=1 Tax=Streptomyces broussonetiae TaxID=2686304 RepID=A0ABV5EAH2_9ACTN
MTSGPSNLGFYLSGGILLLVCALKIPALVRRRDDPLLRAACLLLFSAGWLMILAAPDSIAGLNRLTGIPNIAAPVVYALTTAFSGASLVLIINWRPAPPEQTQRLTRLWVTAYGLTALAIVALFWAGKAPVEQPTLFDAYYATTPYLREMIVLYLVAQGMAMTVASALCWRWSGEVDGSLRAGLRILAPAYLIIVCYDAIRLTAVTARWTGHDLDYLVDKVSPLLAAPACLLGALGFAVPLIGPRVAETAGILRQLWQLQPLWRTLRNVPTPGAVRVSLPWWRTPPAVLLTGRKTMLYDALLALTPYYDAAVREAAYHAALRDGEEDSSAAITADAAMVLVARERQTSTPGQLPPATRSLPWRAHDLVLLSQALASPGTRNLREYSTPSQKAAHHE